MKHKVIILLLILFVIILISSLGVISFTESSLPRLWLGEKEIRSPGNWVNEEQIKISEDQVILNIKNPLWAGFTDTNSMIPIIDENANAIEITPSRPEDIALGDIISYHTEQGVIIHRVVDIGNDELGTYYLVKGDYNRLGDPVKVRFENITGVVVAVIY